MNADQYFDHWNGRGVWRNLKNPKHQRRFDIMAARLVGKTFADVGCGFGHSTAELEIRKPGEWTGIDFTERGVAKACEFFPERTFAFAPDFTALAGMGPFNGVVCSEVLEHVEEDQALATALLKITKVVLIISTPNRHVGDPGHLRIYTESALRTLFEAARVCSIIEDGPFFFGEIHP
jgi:2-polyprenyl-3-methyl-5-hydroxy-6-metoxy-1,4-benzoquinol methylase